MSFWSDFLSATGRDEETLCSGEVSFDATLGTGATSDAKLALALSGRKRAFFSALDTLLIEGEELPLTGELYLLTDRAGVARAVIELTKVEVVPFERVTSQMVALDGEDESLPAWQEKEKEILEDEAAIVGFSFTPQTKLIFQEFRCIYRA